MAAVHHIASTIHATAPPVVPANDRRGLDQAGFTGCRRRQTARRRQGHRLGTVESAGAEQQGSRARDGKQSSMHDPSPPLWLCNSTIPLSRRSNIRRERFHATRVWHVVSTRGLRPGERSRDHGGL
jgi:hypothetical protein